MPPKDTLYVKCKKCGATVPTGFAIPRGTKAILKNNVVGPCPSCGRFVPWDDRDAFYEDGMRFLSH